MSRLIVVHAGRRGPGHDPILRDLPESIVNVARYWKEYTPSQVFGLKPTIVQATDAARDILIDCRKQAEQRYDQCEAAADAAGCSIWGRVAEMARKLTLIYAASADHHNPVINTDAAQWACDFACQQAEQMLSMASGRVSDNPFHELCLKAVAKIREAPSQSIPHQTLLRRMRISTKDLKSIIETLQEQGEVRVETSETSGRPAVFYSLTA